MSYTEHSDLNRLDADLILWRYMNLAKFISILSTSQLFFARVDSFKKDPWEGIPPKSVLEYFEKKLEVLKKQNVKFSNFYREKVIPRHFLNCWHQNDVESAAMWSLYGKSNEAIAIRSKIGLLEKCFSAEPERILIGQVKYGDHQEWQLPDDIAEGPVDKWTFSFFFKRKSFEHEREVRAVIGMPPTRPIIENGYSAKIDVPMLIDRVFVAPNSAQWFVEIVKSVMEKYGLNSDKVNHSAMDDDPIL
jgi:hypothetical protein